MKLREVLKNINSVFRPPQKKYYFGRKIYGCPYFDPMNFLSSIIYIRKLKRRTEAELNSYLERYPYKINNIGNNAIYSNYPMVNRNKYWIVKDWYIKIGWPIFIKTVDLGWKDKWSSPRFEWSPSFQIYFFCWQFCVFWNAPDGDNDQYYEQILWYLKYSDKDIIKAKETWPWTNFETKESTWNDDYFIKH